MGTLGPGRLGPFPFLERHDGLGRLRSFVFRMDESTRVKWANVLADHRRAGVRLGAMLRQSNESAARLSEGLRRFQEMTGVPGSRPR